MLTLDEVIGKGGFGTVYRGTMRSPDGLTRRVAVKVLSAEMSREERAVARFRDEARLLALIDHPGLVPVYALEKIDEKWAVVMGYVDGFELYEASRIQRVPASAVREIGIQLADVLAALWTHPHPDTGHPLHVVHRDIKPHNVMIQPNGRVRLLDLGVASARFEARESKTQGGEIAGTMAYMSPARWARKNDDHAGDVYALGATLFQLLADTRPSWAGSDRETHEEQLEMMSGKVRNPDLFEIIERAMAWDAADRPTAAELAVLLRKLPVPEGDTLAEWATSVKKSGAMDATYEERSGNTDTAPGTFDVSSEAFLDSFVSNQPTVQPKPPESRFSRQKLAVAGLAMVCMVGAAGGVAWMTMDPVLEGEPIRLVLTPSVKAETILAEHQPIKEYLEDVLRRPVAMIVADSYEDAAGRLTAGEADFVMMPHRIGSETWARDGRVRPLVTKVVNGSTSVEGYLVIRHDDQARTLEDLRGQTICYSGPKSNTGHKLPRDHIIAGGMDPDVDFVARFSGNHEKVLEDVLAGECRFGGTFAGNFVTADQRGIAVAQLKIFALTGSVPHDSLWTLDTIDAQLVTDVTEALVALDPKEHLGIELIGGSERMSGFAAAAFKRPEGAP